MEISSTWMWKLVEGLCFIQDVRSFVLAMLNISVELSSEPLGMQVWDSGEEFRMDICKRWQIVCKPG